MKHLKKIKLGIMLLVLLGLPVVYQQKASAHQLPSNCNSNNLSLTVSKDKTVVRNGDVISYTIIVSNLNGGSDMACDVTGADITFTKPAANGTPTGSAVNLANGVNYPAGTPSTTLGTVQYTVAVNSGVTDAIAQVNVTGKLHDAPVDNDVEITKSVGTTVTQPHMTLTKSVSPTSGTAPLIVTYTFQVTNDSSTSDPISNVSVNDPNCSALKMTGGDTNPNGLLDPEETWTFSCTHTFNTCGNFPNSATVTGIDTTDNLAVDQATAQAAVNVNCNGKVLGVSFSSPSGPGKVLAATLPGLPNTGSAKAARGSQDSLFLLGSLTLLGGLLTYKRRQSLLN